MPAPLVATDFPGVYTRGCGYVAIWRQDGRQRQKSFATMTEAVQFKREQRDRKDALVCELLIRERQSKDHIGEAYGGIRKAAQALDLLGMDSHHATLAVRRAQRALVRAEDALKEAY